jgi:hypothetical protein
MRINIHFVVAFLLLSGLSNAQPADTVLKGMYYGYNLYVINPLTAQGTYSITDVEVNGRPSRDQLKSSAFEVDFELMSLETGKAVEVKMVYDSAYPPVIVNSEDLLPPDDFRFVNTNSRRGKLFWRISGRPGTSPFVVEQFKWNKWVKLVEIDVSDTVEAGLYGIDIEPHSGLNTYRIKKIDARGQIVFSKDEKYRAGEQAEVNIVPSKNEDELMFSYETAYEIYSANGKLLKRGKEKYVDIKDLPRGKYYVNFDNKTEIISKR